MEAVKKYVDKLATEIIVLWQRVAQTLALDRLVLSCCWFENDPQSPLLVGACDTNTRGRADIGLPASHNVKLGVAGVLSNGDDCPNIVLMPSCPDRAFGAWIGSLRGRPGEQSF
jgi:hypothetical protein